MLKTTITGSLPKPSWLAQPETLWAPWAAEDPAKLEEAKQDAVGLAIRGQEQAGIDLGAAGERSGVEKKVELSSRRLHSRSAGRDVVPVERLTRLRRIISPRVAPLLQVLESIQ